VHIRVRWGLSAPVSDTDWYLGVIYIASWKIEMGQIVSISCVMCTGACMSYGDSRRHVLMFRCDITAAGQQRKRRYIGSSVRAGYFSSFSSIAFLKKDNKISFLHALAPVELLQYLPGYVRVQFSTCGKKRCATSSSRPKQDASTMEDGYDNGPDASMHEILDIPRFLDRMPPKLSYAHAEHARNSAVRIA
jgi:hypothetical protein